MTPPQLIFFCEPENDALQAFFAQPSVIDDLLHLQASVSLALLDLSAERAALVRRLNEVGIPVVAWLLLPKAQGYFLTMENLPQMTARYTDFQAWTARYDLCWAGVGLDLELDIREFQQSAQSSWRGLATWLGRAFNNERLRTAQKLSRTLIAQMHADGYRVESYQLFTLVEIRRTGSRMIQRMIGQFDLPVEREVLMVYPSMFGSLGPAILWSYAQQAQSVAIGFTGGGTQVAGGHALPLLDWQAFSGDLLLAHRWCDDLHVYSLEGCVEQDFLSRLVAFDWDRPLPSVKVLRQVAWLRTAFQIGLWVTAHPYLVLGSLLSALWLLSRLRSREQ